MTLLEEQKLFAKFMGWGNTLGTTDNSWDKKGSVLKAEDLTLHLDDKALDRDWQEVYERMEMQDRARAFEMELLVVLSDGNYPAGNFDYLIAKPSIKWKALITAISEEK